MNATPLLFIILLTLVGAFTLDSFVFHIIYLVAGAYLLGSWWTNRSLSALKIGRKFLPYAFPGEDVSVQLQVNNPTLLPVPWLHLQESLPLEASTVKVIRQVFSLSPKGSYTIDYRLHPRKRGYYPLGPIQFSSSDLLGLSPEVQISGQSSFLTVFPQVSSLKPILSPSRSPQGTLRHHQPIFEDPTRSMSKREYSPGDSLRRIDWKSTAAAGRLQVKQYQPSIALETMLFLDLDRESYYHKSLYDASELAVVISASLANWITERKQAVGLITNGIDSLVKQVPQPLRAGKGRANLIHLLETLARIDLNNNLTIIELIRQNRPRLSWGTTIIIITSLCNQDLLDELVASKRAGLNIMLVLVGIIPDAQQIKSKVEILNIPFFIFHDEQDLKIWRGS